MKKSMQGLVELFPESNANVEPEKAFIYATFWYEKVDGSQYIADNE